MVGHVSNKEQASLSVCMYVQGHASKILNWAWTEAKQYKFPNDEHASSSCATKKVALNKQKDIKRWISDCETSSYHRDGQVAKK